MDEALQQEQKVGKQRKDRQESLAHSSISIIYDQNVNEHFTLLVKFCSHVVNI